MSRLKVLRYAPVATAVVTATAVAGSIINKRISANPQEKATPAPSETVTASTSPSTKGLTQSLDSSITSNISLPEQTDSISPSVVSKRMKQPATPIPNEVMVDQLLFYADQAANEVVSYRGSASPSTFVPDRRTTDLDHSPTSPSATVLESPSPTDPIPPSYSPQPVSFPHPEPVALFPSQDPGQLQASTNPTIAQEPSTPLYIEPIPTQETASTRSPRYYPGFNLYTPSAFGANWGDVFAGASLIDREFSYPQTSTDNAKPNGSAAIGFGIGDSHKTVGLETVYNIISLTPSRFAENGSVDFKLHRALGNTGAVAAGWENAISYGPEAGGTDSSVYGVVSKVWPLQPKNPNNPMLLGVSAGVGGGRFRPFDDQVKGKDSVGVFGSVGLQVLPNASVITEWSGQSLNVGVSYVPFKKFPLFLSAAALDVANSTPLKTRYTLGASVGFNFN